LVKHELVPTEIALYNLRGQKVRTLVDRPLAAGEHQINWNGKNEAGKLVSAGLYLAKIRNGQEIMTHKMILLK
jgi:flagellar hook assembly protein FlgD